jgi:hypothetical protein
MRALAGHAGGLFVGWFNLRLSIPTDRHINKAGWIAPPRTLEGRLAFRAASTAAGGRGEVRGHWFAVAMAMWLAAQPAPGGRPGRD